MITAVYRGFSGGPSRVGKLIKRLDRVRWCGKKRAPVINHVYRRFEFDDRPSIIAESHFNGGVQLTPAETFVRAVQNGKVDHCYEKQIDVTPKQMEQLWKDHTVLHGDGYDIGLILRYWFWIRVRGRDMTKEFVRSAKNKKWTCNEYYVATGATIEPDLPDLDLRLTPEALFILTFDFPSAIWALTHRAIETTLIPPEASA